MLEQGSENIFTFASCQNISAFLTFEIYISISCLHAYSIHVPLVVFILGLKRMHTNFPKHGQSHSAFNWDVLLKEDTKKGGRKLYSSEVTLYTFSCK